MSGPAFPMTTWTLGQVGEFTDHEDVVHPCRITKLYSDEPVIEIEFFDFGMKEYKMIHRDEFRPT